MKKAAWHTPVVHYTDPLNQPVAAKQRRILRRVRPHLHRWGPSYLVALIALVLGSLAAAHWGVWAHALRAFATLQRLRGQAIIVALICDVIAVILLGLLWQRLIRQFGVCV